MKPFLSTIYCDDIRHEVGGKLSLMGVYNGVLYVPQFPATLQKIWIKATLVVNQDDPPKTLKMRVFKDNEPIADLDALPDYLAQLANARESGVPLPEGTQKVLSSHAHVCISPLVLDGPCTLRIAAFVGKDEVRGVGLQVQQQPVNA